MIWEQQLSTIVMLTRCVEDGKVYSLYISFYTKQMDSQYYILVTFTLPYAITTSTIRRAYKFCLQEKCEHYWPDQVNTSIKIGSEFTVTLVLYVPSAEYQIRKIQLKSVKNI